LFRPKLSGGTVDRLRNIKSGLKRGRTNSIDQNQFDPFIVSNFFLPLVNFDCTGSTKWRQSKTWSELQVKPVREELYVVVDMTSGEWDERGNPAEMKYYDYMKSYSPYDNVGAMDYPNLLVTTSLHDSQLQYREPAK